MIRGLAVGDDLEYVGQQALQGSRRRYSCIATSSEARSEVRRRRLPIMFPFEFRAVAGDDIWLSPMNAGPCVSISFHQYAKMPWTESFAVVEAVFRAHGSRPHWAKRHTLTSDDVLRLYPMAERWGAARRQADPGGKFMNRHLEDVFAFSVQGASTSAKLKVTA